MVTYRQLGRAVTRSCRQSGELRVAHTHVTVDYLMWHLEREVTPRSFTAEHPEVPLPHVRAISQVWIESKSETEDRTAARRRVRQQADTALLRAAVARLLAVGGIELPTPPDRIKSRSPSGGLGRTEAASLFSNDATARAWGRECVTLLRKGAAEIRTRPIDVLWARELAERLNEALERAHPQGPES